MRRVLDPEWAQVRGAGLRHADVLGLRALGIRCTAWPSPSRIDLLLRDKVAFRRRRFDFLRDVRGEDVEAVTAYTLLARSPCGMALDVVAWHPRSGRTATWLGRTGLLGQEFPCPATAEDPLVVFLDVGAWLAQERRGVVVVDEALARPALLDAGTLQAADVAHGVALEAMLSKVRLPRIVVPAFPAERAAA